jgi:PIN domain nuclease of toxin-antitoxin system
MKYLIDTHILIWHTEGNRQLKASFIRELSNPQNQIFVSKVSLREIAIKASLGKLQMAVQFPDLQKFLIANNFQILDYNFDILKTVMSLPFYHNDPFDRLLISQSITENLILLTDDSKFEAYKAEGLNLG